MEATSEPRWMVSDVKEKINDMTAYVRLSIMLQRPRRRKADESFDLEIETMASQASDDHILHDVCMVACSAPVWDMGEGGGLVMVIGRGLLEQSEPWRLKESTSHPREGSEGQDSGPLKPLSGTRVLTESLESQVTQ